MAKTQHRPHSALSGRRYGSFVGKDTATEVTPHPVAVLTQHRPFAAIAGRRYGSFAGKAGDSLTEWFLAGVEELEFSASVAASGNFAFGHLIDQVGPVALTASISASGNFSFAAPLPVTPGSRFIGPRVGLRANGELIILF